MGGSQQRGRSRADPSSTGQVHRPSKVEEDIGGGTNQAQVYITTLWSLFSTC